MNWVCNKIILVYLWFINSSSVCKDNDSWSDWIIMLIDHSQMRIQMSKYKKTYNKDDSAHGSHCAGLSSCFSVCVSFSCFCLSNTTGFTRDKLLNIWQNTPQNLLRVFDNSDELLLSVDYQLPDRQAAASEAGKIHIQHPHRQHVELLRAVFSPHCSSPCTPMTAHLKTPLSNSWSLQMTPQSSASQDGDESAYRQDVEQLAVWF